LHIPFYFKNNSYYIFSFWQHSVFFITGRPAHNQPVKKIIGEAGKFADINGIMALFP